MRTALSFTEADALGKRQLGGIVDRHGLAAHVVFPGIAAAFATAAGVFFAAERAADFRAAGADVDVGDAAIATAPRRGTVRLRADRS